MGDKITAKEAASALGIPVGPGSKGAVEDEAQGLKLAADMGYPVLIKATAGGGGRGMKVVRSPEEFGPALAQARRARPSSQPSRRSVSESGSRTSGTSSRSDCSAA